MLRLRASVLWNFQGHRNIMNIMVYVLSKMLCAVFNKIWKFTVMFRIKMKEWKQTGDLAKLKKFKNKNTNRRNTWNLENQWLANEKIDLLKLILIKSNSIIMKNKLYHNECTSSKTLVIDNPYSELLPNCGSIKLLLALNS